MRRTACSLDDATTLRRVDATKTTHAPVVVLGVGPTALGVVRCLGRAGLGPYLVTRPGDLSELSKWARGRVVHLAEPSSADELSALCDRLGLEQAVVVPCTDEWMKLACRLPDDGRLLASVPSPEVVDLLVDKELFARTLDRFEVPHPRTQPVESERDLDGDLGGLFLKPRQSQLFAQHYHEKALTFEDRDGAVHALELMARIGVGAILQEYVPGPPTSHYFIDGFVRADGTTAALFARRRIRMFPLEFGNSTLMVSVPVAEVQRAADDLTQLLTGIGYRGVFSAEFKLDARDGAFKLLEINSRPWWYVEFASRCGVDVCEMAYRDALSLSVPGVERYEIGKRCVFLPLDVRAYRALRSAGELGFVPWIRSWLGAVRTVFALSDPLPGLALPVVFLRRRRRLTRER